MIVANGAHLLNNETGVRFEPLTLGQTGVSGTLNGTDFIVDDDYLGDINTDEPHLIMDNCGEVWVKNCNFWHPFPSSIFKGIEIINTTTQWSENNYLTTVPISIRSGGVLTNTGTLRHLGTSITVYPGSKLIVNGGTHKNAHPMKQWPGITIFGTSNNLPGQIIPQVQITNNGKIENAFCGITVKNGGIVHATDAQFINNPLGIKFEPVSLFKSGESGRFANTHFTLDSNYLGDMEEFESHLVMENCGEVLAMGSTFTIPASINPDYAILVKNSPLILTDTTKLYSAPVSIQTGATLTLSDNGALLLAEKSKLIIDVSGHLTIGNNALVYGIRFLNNSV